MIEQALRPALDLGAEEPSMHRPPSTASALSTWTSWSLETSREVAGTVALSASMGPKFSSTICLYAERGKEQICK